MKVLYLLLWFILKDANEQADEEINRMRSVRDL